MQANAEHQKDHPDIGELQCQVGVGDETGGERADHDPGQQIADQGRQLQAQRRGAHHKGQAQAHDENSDQRRHFMHGATIER